MTLKRNDTISESCVLSQVLVDQIRIRLIRGLTDDSEREERFQPLKERRGVFPLFGGLIRARRRGILKNAFGFHFAFRQQLAQLFQTIGRLANDIPHHVFADFHHVAITVSPHGRAPFFSG